MVLRPFSLFTTSKRNLRPTTDRRHNRNLRSRSNGSRQSARISGILITDKNIDVLANLSLLGGDAVANARVESPEEGQGIGQSGR